MLNGIQMEDVYEGDFITRRALLWTLNFTMKAYYFGFDATGVGAVDAILSAVAIAGKGAHHTQDWNDDGSGYYSDRPGLAPNTGVEEGSAATLIELTAVRSAARISALVADHAALLAEVRRSPSAVPVVDDATRQEVEKLITDIRAMRPDPSEPAPPGWDADDREGDRNVYRSAELLAAAYLPPPRLSDASYSGRIYK